MNNRRFCFVFLFLLFCITANSSHAADPVTRKFVRKSFSVADCEIASMTVKCRFHLLNNDPFVKCSYKWVAAPGASPTCLPHDTKIFVKVSAAGSSGYVKVSPVVTASGKAFGFTINGLPGWEKIICGSGAEKDTCLAASVAQTMWSEGLSIDGFDVTGSAAKTQSETKQKEARGERSAGGAADGIVSVENVELGAVSIFSENVAAKPESSVDNIFSELGHPFDNKLTLFDSLGGAQPVKTKKTKLQE